MEYGLHAADYAVMAGFFVVLLAVGVYYAGRMHDLKDFFSGGRQVPWWLAGISLYMTTFSAFTFVSYSALAYKHGLVAVTIWWFSVPGCLLSAWFLAARWRRAATTSPVEYLETRFSPALRQAFSWFGIPLIVFDDALKLFVIGSLISLSLGFENTSDTLWAIGICGMIMVVYTLLGGLWAVLVTDCVQFVVMAIAVVVLVPLAYLRAGGLTAIAEHAPDEFLHITAGDFTWPWLLSFSVILALTFATKWPYVQRYYAARSDRDARRVGYLVATLTVLAPPFLFFPALAARVFLPDVSDLNQVYGLLCRQLLPVGMMGILLAAMFSATMSMLSSDYNSLASVITNDIIKRVFVPNVSDKSLVTIARTVTLAVGAIAMVLALLFARAENLQDLVKIMAKLFAGLLPPVALPMMAGLVSRRTSNGGALLGFAAGALCGITAFTLSYQPGLAYLQSVPYLTWITLIPTAAGLLIGTAFFPLTESRQGDVDAFLTGLQSDYTEKPSLIEGGDAAVAMRIIGLTILLLGAILALAVLINAGFTEGWLSIVVGLIMAIGGAATVTASYRLSKAQP